MHWKNIYESKTRFKQPKYPPDWNFSNNLIGFFILAQKSYLIPLGSALQCANTMVWGCTKSVMVSLAFVCRKLSVSCLNLELIVQKRTPIFIRWSWPTTNLQSSIGEQTRISLTLLTSSKCKVITLTKENWEIQLFTAVFVKLY